MYALRFGFGSFFTIVALFIHTIAQQPDDSKLFPINLDNSTTTYIDEKGKVILTVPYGAGRFFEGLARINVNGKIGYINSRGELVIPPQDISSGNWQRVVCR